MIHVPASSVPTGHIYTANFHADACSLLRSLIWVSQGPSFSIWTWAPSPDLRASACRRAQGRWAFSIPSLARAPKGLCALQLRCGGGRPAASMPRREPAPEARCWDAKEHRGQRLFKGTAVAALDSDLRVLGWTWLLNAPQHQVHSSPNPSRWFVPVGAADRFLRQGQGRVRRTRRGHRRSPFRLLRLPQVHL